MSSAFHHAGNRSSPPGKSKCAEDSVRLMGGGRGDRGRWLAAGTVVAVMCSRSRWRLCSRMRHSAFTAAVLLPLAAAPAAAAAAQQSLDADGRGSTVWPAAGSVTERSSRLARALA